MEWQFLNKDNSHSWVRISHGLMKLVTDFIDKKYDDNEQGFQYCTDPSGQEILDLRALQGHSGRNPIDPSLQDNVLIPDSVFEYIYHVGCAINLHSITNSGFDTGRTKFERKTDGFLYVCGSYEQRTQRSE